MITLEQTSPTVVRIHGVESTHLGLLRANLQYVDKKVEFEIQKLKRNVRMYHMPNFQERLDQLKGQRVKCLLFKDDDGYWTYSGLAQSLVRTLQASYISRVTYPDPKPLPWAKKPFEPFPYQTLAHDALFRARHAGVEIGTGLGKSLIITYLIKSLGLKTVVMAPSLSIARQLQKGLISAFGRKCVGFYGDGRKDLGKLITVAIGASLTRIGERDEAWGAFAKTQVFIADESHLCPAQTLNKVCFGLMTNAPYRFFFSATQLRNDGLDLLLDAISGPIVYRMSVKEGIDKGYLAKLKTTLVKVPSRSYFESRDVLEMTRQHLYYNPGVNKAAAQIINRFIDSGRQVLVLVEELEQFTHLLPFLREATIAFAHGGDPKGVLPEKYRKSDPEGLVEQFNAGQLPVLVGTSCISTGTDVKANQMTVYIRGGKSEIEVMQGAVGRSTRLHEPVGKKACDIIDFDVYNIDSLHRHTGERLKYYAQVGGVEEWKI
jgi:superfamily II DNA or RNA helicase